MVSPDVARVSFRPSSGWTTRSDGRPLLAPNVKKIRCSGGPRDGRGICEDWDCNGNGHSVGVVGETCFKLQMMQPTFCTYLLSMTCPTALARAICSTDFHYHGPCEQYIAQDRRSRAILRGCGREALRDFVLCMCAIFEQTGRGREGEGGRGGWREGADGIEIWRPSDFSKSRAVCHEQVTCGHEVVELQSIARGPKRKTPH